MKQFFIKPDTLKNRLPQRRVFFDIDTQFDFMNPAGRLYVNGAASIMGNLKK